MKHILNQRPCVEVTAAFGLKPNTVSQKARRVLIKVIHKARPDPRAT